MAKLGARDLEVLTTVGRFRMLTRAQLKRWIFDEVSEPVVTRVVTRLAAAHLLGVERLGGNGVQVMWLTRKGRDLLESRGVGVGDLFPAAGPVAAKDFSHTVEIGNAALWLRSRTPAPDEVVPAWQLQRAFHGNLAAIPDLLALWRTPAAALAVEVDLATEPVTTVLVPKLQTLATLLTAYFVDALVSIAILVPSERRAKNLREALRDSSIPAAVELLDVCAGC